MGQKRRKFSREFKIETVRLITEKGYSIAQVGRDLDLRPNLLRRWKKQLAGDPAGAFPGEGRVRAEDQEMFRLRRDNQRWRRYELDYAKYQYQNSKGRPEQLFVIQHVLRCEAVTGCWSSSCDQYRLAELIRPYKVRA